VNFFADYNNLALIAIAVVSGGLLAWPQIKAGTGGKRVNTAAATQLINRACGGGGYPRRRRISPRATCRRRRARHLPIANRASGLQGRRARILVCQNGQALAKAQAALKEAGYSEVYALEAAGRLAAGRPAGREGRPFSMQSRRGTAPGSPRRCFFSQGDFAWPASSCTAR
jgi:rhodanese-related sulfurtransferase